VQRCPHHLGQGVGIPGARDQVDGGTQLFEGCVELGRRVVSGEGQCGGAGEHRVYGTDVFCAMVQRPAHVDDRALLVVMTNIHRYGDRRMPVPGVLGMLAAAISVVRSAGDMKGQNNGQCRAAHHAGRSAFQRPGRGNRGVSAPRGATAAQCHGDYLHGPTIRTHIQHPGGLPPSR
jgi:hypothetical protein